jgi:hypothetical protein
MSEGCIAYNIPRGEESNPSRWKKCNNTPIYYQDKNGDLLQVDYCQEHFINLTDRLNGNFKIPVYIKDVTGQNFVEMCMDKTQDNIKPCTDIKVSSPMYSPRSQNFVNQSASSPTARAKMIKRGSPFSPRSPVVVYDKPVLANIIPLPPKKICDETTGRGCKDKINPDNYFTEGPDRKKKRRNRPRPDVKRNCVPPHIDLKSTGIPAKLEKLDDTKSLNDAFEMMSAIRSTIEMNNEDEEKDKKYNWSVDEQVVDMVAEKFARYMYNPDRIELLLSYIFDYETRDLTQKLSYYGFKTFEKVDTRVGNLLDKSSADILMLSSVDDKYKARAIPDIEVQRYRNTAEQLKPKPEKTDSGSDDPKVKAKQIIDKIKAGLTCPDGKDIRPEFKENGGVMIQMQNYIDKKGDLNTSEKNEINNKYNAINSKQYCIDKKSGLGDGQKAQPQTTGNLATGNTFKGVHKISEIITYIYSVKNKEQDQTVKTKIQNLITKLNEFKGTNDPEVDYKLNDNNLLSTGLSGLYSDVANIKKSPIKTDNGKNILDSNSVAAAVK